MRDILNKLEKITLTEASRGLLYRDQGDTFFSKSNPDDVLTFQKVEYFPGMPGEYEDYNELATEAQKIVINYPGIQYVNTPNAGTKAFAILTLTDNDGNGVYVCRFFKKISTDMAGQWKNNDLPGDWQLTKGSSIKSSHGLKPTDLFAPNSIFNSPLEIVSALQGKDKVKDLLPGLQMLLGGQMPVFEGKADMIPAIQDDLGEIIAPIALVLGMITDQGAEAARKDVLGGDDWKGSQIIFPDSKTNGLVDSFVIKDGIEVGISSKGKKGAKASIKNVYDGIDYVKEKGTSTQKKMITKYADQIAILDEISAASSVEFPVKYATKRGMISQRVGTKILELIKSGVKTLNQATSLTAADKKELDHLMGLLNPEAKPGYSVGYHALAGLAKIVAADINSDPKFGEMCIKFVNASPVIQVYLTVGKKGNNAVATKLTSLYPPNFEGAIVLDPGKVYFATGTNGKMAFGYSPTKNASKTAEKEVASNKRVAAINDKIEQIASGASVDIRPKRAQTTKVDTVKGHTREKR